MARSDSMSEDSRGGDARDRCACLTPGATLALLNNMGLPTPQPAWTHHAHSPHHQLRPHTSDVCRRDAASPPRRRDKRAASPPPKARSQSQPRRSMSASPSGKNAARPASPRANDSAMTGSAERDGGGKENAAQQAPSKVRWLPTHPPPLQMFRSLCSSTARIVASVHPPALQVMVSVCRERRSTLLEGGCLCRSRTRF